MTDSFLTRILGELQNISAGERLAFIKAEISKIDDPDQRELAETALFLGMSVGAPVPREHVVVLVHGIRTYAEWQERLAGALTDKGHENVYPVGYGFFDVLSFLCPIWTRRRPIDRVLREFRAIKTKHRDADISVVAHSFGTYILSQILEDATDVSLHRVILCGCIVPLKFRWDKVMARVKGVVINEVGTLDYWPVIARLVTWGYGASGTFGFKTSFVRDRFHNCGHSDFFEDDLMSKYWLPMLLDGQVVPSDWTRTRSRSSALVSFLSWLPLKSLLLIGAVTGVAVFAMHRVA
ncbi:hypothetical protein PQQ52_20330 [Paraburkholderia sediminicola]|uniref:hypothetical protein n=1 Tax=Paraburkholderia sediminicola TaxID=458836 RepID=UPI0038B847CA